MKRLDSVRVSPKEIRQAALWPLQPYEKAGKSSIYNCFHSLTSKREYISKKDRKAYIEAVQCLRRLPPRSDPSWAPAAKNRFDDFVAIHVNQTLFIHGNGPFLTWHRYFVWAYEQALRNECGYKGYQPVSLNLSTACKFRILTHSPSASTGTGLHMRITSTSPPFLTGVTPVWVVTANFLHTTEALLAVD